MTTPPRIPHAIRRPLRTWTRRLLDVVGDRVDGQNLSEPPAARTRSVSATHPECAHVTHVEDPDGAGVLVRVVGRADHHTVDRIDEITGRLEPHSSLHLDLFDASIPIGPVMHELAMLADRLEQALIRVRMVGLDPHQPAIELR